MQLLHALLEVHSNGKQEFPQAYLSGRLDWNVFACIGRQSTLSRTIEVKMPCILDLISGAIFS